MHLNEERNKIIEFTIIIHYLNKYLTPYKIVDEHENSIKIKLLLLA